MTTAATGRFALDALAHGVLGELGGAAAAQRPAGLGFRGLGGRSDLVQAWGAVAAGEQVHPTPDVDRCNLGGITDQ